MNSNPVVIPPPPSWLPPLLPAEKSVAPVDVTEFAQGCLVSTSFSDASCVEKILAFFRHGCEGDQFSSSIADCGFHGPRFTFNEQFMAKGNPGFDKFVKGISKKKGAGDPKLAVVFHGTRPSNVEEILQNGLDPKLRKGQAYGPGEYFSKTPGVSVGYCKGGKQILVFVVLLPQTRSSTIPPDYVVIENNGHQLPVGVLHFDSVDHVVLRKSQSMRVRLMKLSQNALQTSQLVECAKLKAKIMQRLIAGEFDLAADVWERSHNRLDMVTKHEISWYAHKQLDEDVLPVLFPELPEPLSPEELAEANVTSVEDAKQKEDAAKKQLEDAHRAIQEEKAARKQQLADSRNVTQASGAMQHQNYQFQSHLTGPSAAMISLEMSRFRQYALSGASSATNLPASATSAGQAQIQQQPTAQQGGSGTFLFQAVPTSNGGITGGGMSQQVTSSPSTQLDEFVATSSASSEGPNTKSYTSIPIEGSPAY